jgi:hypothetical protein
MSTPSDEMLMAYVDGELDAEDRALVEKALPNDAQLAARVARHRALRDRLQTRFGDVLLEPVPDRLLAAAQGAVQHRGTIIDWTQASARPARPVRTLAWPRWGAIAASLIVGLLAGRLLPHGGGGLTEESNGVLLASGALDQALTTQLAASAAGPVVVGLTFRDRGGHYCRTFAVDGARPQAGLACRQTDRWQVLDLQQVEAPGTAPGDFRQAASTLPAPLLAAISERIRGEALDARQEAAARAARWQPSGQ